MSTGSPFEFFDLAASHTEVRGKSRAWPAVPGTALLLFVRRFAEVQRRPKHIQQRLLTLQDVLTGSGDRKPIAAIHLWKFNDPSGAWRPFHLAQVAGQPGRIAIAFERPRGY